MLQKFEISNGSVSLISSFFTLCSKARVFEQWGLVTWKTHILREMRWSKEFSFTNICRFATWRVERIFQAIRQRSRDLANMKRRYFTPLLMPIDALIVLKKISVILWQRVSHFLFLDTNRQCARVTKRSLGCHDFYVVLSPETLQANLVNYFLQLWFMCLVTQKPTELKNWFMLGSK